jgi:dTDP-4-amino-4,6-dideoxygalactose transaminase
MIPVTDLSRMHARIRPELDAAIARVLDRDWYILGPEVEAFEAEFAAYLGVRHVVGVGNGTDAITLTLRALGIGPGDEVITTAFTAAPTVGAIVAAGATPVFADVYPTTRTLDASAAFRAVTKHTRAIMPVHLYGLVAWMDNFKAAGTQHALMEAYRKSRPRPKTDEELRAVAERYRLPIIEDAAQAHGAEYQGVKAGNLGHVACFSFYPTKNLGALGDGGAIATNDPSLAERLRRLRNLGQAARYVHVEHATHSRLDEVQAAVLRVKLAHLDEWTAERRALAARYGRLLGPCEGAALRLPSEPAGVTSCWHQYVVEVADGERETFRERLKAAGVGTDVHYPTPVHLQPGYGAYGTGSGSLRISERLARTVVSLPMFVGLTAAEQETVAGAVRSYMATIPARG